MGAISLVFWLVLCAQVLLVTFYVYSAHLRGGASKAEAGREAAFFVCWIALGGSVLLGLGHYCQYDIRTLESSQYPLFGLGLLVAILGILQALKLVNKASHRGGLK